MAAEVKPHLTWVHGDVGGLTIFNDGVRAYWTEGRSSSVLFTKPGSDVEYWVCNASPDYGEWDPYMEILNGDMGGEFRQMNRQQELDFDRRRGNKVHYGDDD